MTGMLVRLTVTWTVCEAYFAGTDAGTVVAGTATVTSPEAAVLFTARVHPAAFCAGELGQPAAMLVNLGAVGRNCAAPASAPASASFRTLCQFTYITPTSVHRP